MKEVMNIFLKTVKDCIFPVFCLGCNKEGEWVCEKCFAKIDLSGQFFCPVCHEVKAGGCVCHNCVDDSRISQHVAILKYEEEGLSGRIIYALKYQYAEDIIPLWMSIIDEFFVEHKDLFSEFDYIISVPLHKKRWAKRGFNQSDVIADFVSKQVGAEVLKKTLIRKTNTPHQATLSREERFKNVVDAFKIIEKPAIENKKIIVVDDVFTTGSTIQECAKVLLENGAREVVGFSLARG